jgi:hypothetical protein
MRAENVGIMKKITPSKMLLSYYVQEYDYCHASSKRLNFLRLVVCTFISSNVTETFMFKRILSKENS